MSSQPELIKDLTRVPIPYQVAGTVYLAGMRVLGDYLQDMMLLAYLASLPHDDESETS